MAWLPAALATLRDISRRRTFLSLSVKAEIKSASYTGSWLGSAWWLLEPLLLMFVYVFVVEILRGGRAVPFGALFIYATVLPYRWFSVSTSRATTVLLGSAGLIKQVPFPKIMLPLATALANTAHFLFGTLVLAILIAVYRVPLTGLMLWFPALVAVQFLFILAVGVLLAAATVFVRDIQGLVPFLLRLLLFLSPIFYDHTDVPVRWQPFFMLNPLAPLLTSYKNILLYQQPPLLLPLAGLTVCSLVAIGAGLWLYRRIDNKFARWL